ncbi:MAG TPA: methyl-accepting chemotaxis protein, partial [Bryobacteraceae bacterium]
MTVAFRPSPANRSEFPSQPNAYAIEFEARFETANTDEMRCFSFSGPTGTDKTHLSVSQNRKDWFVRQRGSALANVAGSRADLVATKGPTAEWTLELGCLDHRAVSERIDNWTAAGIKGIKAYAGATGASFIPSLQPPRGGVSILFSAVYGVADRVLTAEFNESALWDGELAPADRNVSVQPRSVICLGPKDPELAEFSFPLCETTARDFFTATHHLSSPPLADREGYRGFVFYSARALESGKVTSQRLRMGSLELSVRNRTASAIDSTPSLFRLEVIADSAQFQADVSFVVTQAYPGGQDDIPTDSFLAANAVVEALPCRLPASVAPADDTDGSRAVELAFYRPRPLLINRAKSSVNTALLLTASEKSGPLANRTLRLALKVDPNVKADSGTQEVVVLDADPFLVAQVSFPTLIKLSGSGSLLIAAWDNANGDGSKWQIPQNPSVDFTLTLPPQAVGEEMVKDKDFKLPADFRFGPPAVVAMKTGLFAPAGQTATNFTEVPWNLRRVLGYSGQTDPGVTVDRLDYELLYGLSCDVSQPFVRLAEVFARLGAIPGRMLRTATASDLQSPNSDIDLYRQMRQAWAETYRRYQSRLAVLEPWDQHVSGSLTLKHGMSCVIRYRITPDVVNACSLPLINRGFTFPPDLSTPAPVQLPPADLEDPITPGPRTATSPLRGGVTWGFESRNIFCATLRNEYSTADYASVSDLDFTALGGFGHQQASFDEGRTSVFADVAMGRTYYYKLERLGRICTLWNKAKHVIVYERSVVPSRQFYLEQNSDPDPKGSYGIPMLRKVEEYIEILEEERRFPDDHLLTNTSTVVQATPAQRCGTLAASVFPKGTKIHVSGSWGSDVYTFDGGNRKPIGWKIPLWKRGAQPADVYPLPKLSLSLYSQFDGGASGSSKESPCDIGNPDSVYFYTDTQANTGSDSDKWPAIAGLDTVALPPPTRPKEDVTKMNPLIPAIGDVAVPAGFSPCTFQLLPPLRPVDIVANRGGSPIATTLDSITLLRGYTGTAKMPDTAQQALDAYRNIWVDLIGQLSAAEWKDKDAIQKRAEKLLDGAQATLSGLTTSIGTKWQSQWSLAVKDFNTRGLAKLKAQITTATAEAASVAGGLKLIANDVEAAIREIKAKPGNEAARLTVLVQRQFAAIQQAVMDASAAPGVLSSLFGHYLEVARGISARLDQGLSDLQSLAKSVAADEDTARDLVARITKQALALRDELQQAWAAAGVYRPLRELADLTQQLEAGPLHDFKVAYDKALSDLGTAVQSAQDKYVDKLKEIQGKVAKLTSLGANAAKALNDYAELLRKMFDLSDVTLRANQALTTALDRFRAEATQIVASGTNWATKTFNDLIDKAGKGQVDQVLAAFHAAIDDNGSLLTDPFKRLNDALSDEAGKIGQTFNDALGGFTGQVNGTLANLKSSFNDAVTKAGTEAADIQAAVLKFRDERLGELHRFVDSNLPILQQSTEDVLANTNQILSLARCFGAAPTVDNLSFFPGKVGYYLLGTAATQVDLSPVTSTLAQAGNAFSNGVNNAVNDALSVMKLNVPAISLADRLIPPELKNFRLSDIFPKFAGIDLSGLFKDINLNEDGGKIHITHGIDPQTRSAWVQADVGAHLQDVPVFETGGVSLRLATADFAGQVRLDASAQGTHQLATGNVTGDWKLLVLGQEVVTLAATQLLFDNTGKLRFIVNPKNVRLPGVMQFVTEYLANFAGSGSGLSIKVKGTALDALLNLPIPDMQGLTSGFSNLSLACNFGIGLDGTDFFLKVGFGLSAPDKPFNVAIFILGGAGYILASASYFPGRSAPPQCSVDFGIMASASLAIALGPISGGVYAFLGIRANFTTGGPGLNLSAVLILRGQVNLAGIVSASICLELSVSDENGRLTGRGRFSISITICWCFTLSIDMDVAYSLGSGGQTTASLGQAAGMHLAKVLAPTFDSPSARFEGGSGMRGGPHEEEEPV